jgi:hypothetical protein
MNLCKRLIIKCRGSGQRLLFAKLVEDDAGNLANRIPINPPRNSLTSPRIEGERQSRAFPAGMSLHEEEDEGGKNR